MAKLPLNRLVQFGVGEPLRAPIRSVRRSKLEVLRNKVIHIAFLPKICSKRALGVLRAGWAGHSNLGNRVGNITTEFGPANGYGNYWLGGNLSWRCCALKLALPEANVFLRQHTPSNLRVAVRAYQKKVFDDIIGWVAVNVMNLQRRHLSLWTESTPRACLLKDSLLNSL